MRPVTTSIRAVRATRITHPLPRRTIRFQSSQNSSSSSPPPSASGAITGGLVGGGAALAITYGWYHFSGAKTTLQTAKQAKGYLDDATNQLKVKFEEKTPDSNQALQTLRDAANKYAGFVPGGKQYVDAAFQDIEALRKNHGDEVDNVVKEAYGELRDVSKKGLNLEAANEAYNVLSKHVQRLLSLGREAIDDILDNHPQLKEKLGGSTDQLKQLGNRLGPEVKQEVDDTWKQVSDLLKSGLSGDAIERARQLVNEKSRKLRELGEKTFNQGYEQLKPYLDNSPQVKQFVESNLETLKQGNIAETMQKVKDAVSSGSTSNLESYLQQIKQKGQQYSSSLSSGDLTQWLGLIPGGSQIIPQLQKLKQVADKQGSEAENLVKETISEIKQVLDKKSERVEKIVESGKEEVKQQ